MFSLLYTMTKSKISIRRAAKNVPDVAHTGEGLELWLYCDNSNSQLSCFSLGGGGTTWLIVVHGKGYEHQGLLVPRMRPSRALGLWNKNTNYLIVMAPGRFEASQTGTWLLKEFLSATRFLKSALHIFDGLVGFKAHGMKAYCHLPANIQKSCNGKENPRRK